MTVFEGVFYMECMTITWAIKLLNVSFEGCSGAWFMAQPLLHCQKVCGVGVRCSLSLSLSFSLSLLLPSLFLFLLLSLSRSVCVFSCEYLLSNNVVEEVSPIFQCVWC